MDLNYLQQYNIMLNKVRNSKEQTRVGKIPESVQYKNKITKSINNSSYEMIRGIVEADASEMSSRGIRDTTSVAQPQMEKQISKNISNLNSHEKYSKSK